MNRPIMALLVSALAWAGSVSGQAPVNDICDQAIPIAVNGGAVNANNSNTASNGPNPTCGGGTLIEDVWYSFVYPGGTMTIQTGLGTNTDTRIAVYTACGGSQIACNDDAAGLGYASLLTFDCDDLTIGTTYLLQAGGYNGVDGAFTITIAADLDGCTDPEANNYVPCAVVDDGNCLYPFPPVNDDCANAIPLSIGSTSPLVENTLANASGWGGVCNTIMKDVWYTFEHDGTELQINVNPGTLADTYVGIYTGCQGTQIECDDDDGPGNAAQILTDCSDLIVGTTYYIRAGGYNANVGTFTVSIASTNSCVLGESCDIPFLAEEGLNEAPVPNSWYAFTPDSSGQWRISTCGLTACDTKLWIYDYCNMLNFDDSNEATYTYNDDFCGAQAEITPLLAGGQTYYLRVGDTDAACDGAALPFLIEFMGPAEGCMDVFACNYSPIAELPGPCYYNDDPECDDLGPDLMVLQNTLFTSLYNTTINATDACLLNEGCVQGFGTRQVLRFTTHIKNIGNQDYYIGAPSANNEQFEWDQCHNHYHYEGYAEYMLFDQEGLPMPQIGFKNGFCVLDLECSGGGVAKYGCGNMGITAGCGDIYGSGLNCQWIDITDVPDGDYFLVVRTNWDQAPDMAGHYELRYDNNWAQVCIHFERDANGNIINFTKNINACAEIIDCLGQPFGNSYPDCQENCPGMVKRGDLDANAMLEEMDVHSYLEGTLTAAVPVSTCTDLNNDGTITVTDAAMLEACIHGQEEQGIPPALMTDCPYDDEIITPFETVALGVYAVNGNMGYADISILNPDNEVRGLEFEISGVQIDSIASLIDGSLWEPHMHEEEGGDHITILSHNETWIPKYFVPTAFLRIYFTTVTDDEVCIASIIDVVNLDNHNTATVIGDCQAILIDFADFTADQTVICAGENVSFTDLSDRTPVSWSWSVDGPVSLTSDEQNPTFTLTEAGTYSVTLTVSDGLLTDSYTIESYITVQAIETWYPDLDGDGFGTDNGIIEACGMQDGYSLLNGDCNDYDALSYPGAEGTANNTDNDCNGVVEGDEVLSCPGDLDGDGVIGIGDVMVLNSFMGCLENCIPGDLNNDSIVNIDDLLMIISLYGTLCD